MAAIQTAASIPESMRGNHNSFGKIVLTADGTWVVPNPDAVFLGGNNTSTESNLVHPQLQADPETLDSLKKLGIKPASAESAFREFALGLLDIPWYKRRAISNEEWHEFWRLARYIDQTEAAKIINESTYRWENWRDKLCVLTISGKWRSLFQTLLPGPIVPADGSRDSDVSIRCPVTMKRNCLSLRNSVPSIRHAPGTNYPFPEIVNLPTAARQCFKSVPKGILAAVLRMTCSCSRKPETSGPLDLLELLSEEAKAKYAWDLLALDDTYKHWDNAT